jgi:4-diphosphocytidyl-2-C-methyl-D-erythritol kinase
MDEVARAIEEATGAGNSELARAKINLALHVGAERADGYHDLESLVVFADIADVVTARPAPKDIAAMALDLSGPHATLLEETEPSSNLALRAAEAIAALAPKRRMKPLSLSLAKRIPVAAGLGGGSADAAATLRLLNRIWGLGLKPEKLAEIAVKLGADVPMCLVSRPLVARGIGEKLTPAAGIPPLAVVLAHPGVSLATAAVFAGLGKEERSPLPALPAKFKSALDLVFWLRQTRNDLIDPARVVSRKAVAAAKALADDPDCLFARMSGSGAAAFGIFVKPAAAERAAERLKAARPDWWVAAAMTGGS